MTSPDPLVGRLLAERYRIGGMLARGGMARVYRAHDERLDRDVAIKVLSPPDAGDPAFVARFLDEARAAASVTHPSLVHVYDSGSDGDAHYIVMELLDRHRSLRQEIDTRGRLDVEEVRRIGIDLLAGLGAVHARGLVHCDLKAGNVMLGPGAAKLIDFGIATAPHGGATGSTSLGSLPYMSPEQLHGRAMSSASDLFSLGVVLYEALSGRTPFRGETPATMSAAHAAGPPVSPSEVIGQGPGPLDDAIMQALRIEPAARYASAAAMTAALAGEHEPSPRSAPRRTAPDDETRSMRPIGLPVLTDAPMRAAPASRGAGPVAVAATLGLIGAAAVVVIFVVLPLLENARGGGPSVSPPPSLAPGGQTVVVPALIGTPTRDAIDAANAAGLDWTLHCNEDPSEPEGIIDQEPPAGTQVARGSPFNLYSARFADCG